MEQNNEVEVYINDSYWGSALFVMPTPCVVILLCSNLSQA